MPRIERTARAYYALVAAIGVPDAALIVA